MVYICNVCGYVHDEEKEGVPVSALTECPRCKQDASHLQPDTSRARAAEGAQAPYETTSPESAEVTASLSFAREFAREDESERCMADIHRMAVTGRSIISAMGVKGVRPGWDDILILGAQLDPMPLAEHAEVDAGVVIGPRAARPMALPTPILVSHMSFGALSREAKVALAKGARMAGAAMCSGEGGVLPEERDAAGAYVFEYVPNRYSDTDENLRRADAVEIKIGQGTKPGMGGHLPGEKVTAEIAAIRGMPAGQDVISPSTFPGIESPEDLARLVDSLRERSGGRPIGVKIAAGRVERDLAFALKARPDFVTLDGRGGATGASPKLVRDSASVPTIYALSRARRFLDGAGEAARGVSLVVTGGLRVSSDFAKAIAMGADAVAIASAALIAAACQQYRICGGGNCPVGVATQDPALRGRMDVEAAARRLCNFLTVSTEELRTFARITGHPAVRGLSLADLCTADDGLAARAGIPHAGDPAR